MDFSLLYIIQISSHILTVLLFKLKNKYLCQWQSIYDNCVSPANTLTIKLKSVTSIVQQYSRYWQRKQSDSTPSAINSQPNVDIIIKFLQGY
jgi:hypothetical protein